MPRIAAALGLVATVAFCIGFNVKRYPRVWEMVTPCQVSGGTPAAVAQTTPSANEAKSAATEGKPAPKEKKPAQRTPVASISAQEETEKPNAKHEHDDSPKTSGNRARSADVADQSSRYAPIQPIPVDTTPTPAKAFAPIPAPNASGDEKPAKAAAQPKKEGGAQAKSKKGKADADKLGKRSDQDKPHATAGNRNKPADDEKSKSAQSKRPADAEKRFASEAKNGGKAGGRPMVPIVIAQAHEPEPSDPFGVGSAYGADKTLKRLPPVDPSQPALGDPYAVVSPGDAATPAYPTTEVKPE